MVLTDVGCTREEGNRRCVWGTNCSLSLDNNLRGEDTSVNHTMLCVRQSRKKILCPHQKLISIFYKILSSGSPETSEDKKLAWCADLGETITGSEWQTICVQSQTQTTNSGFRLLQKIILERGCWDTLKFFRGDSMCPRMCVLRLIPKGNLKSQQEDAYPKPTSSQTDYCKIYT